MGDSQNAASTQAFEVLYQTSGFQERVYPNEPGGHLTLTISVKNEETEEYEAVCKITCVPNVNGRAVVNVIPMTRYESWGQLFFRA